MSGYTSGPTLAGFAAWLYAGGVPGVTATVLPANSTWITSAYEVAADIVGAWPGLVSTTMWNLMTYNLAADNLINFAPDQTGQNFFTNLRVAYGITNATAVPQFVPGIVSSTSDNGTSTSLLNPDFMKEFTLSNLQNLKTPNGRIYLGYAQRMGTVWGLT